MSEIPGPRSRASLASLLRTESRNVTFVDERMPVVWASAKDATVTDVDGNRYTDLTSAFGVANVGHANAHVADVVAQQAHRLMHGMGDVHPPAVKIALLEALARAAPGDLRKTFLATTGSEAVEAALKTAMLATGKHRFVAFSGAYHGLSLGALSVAGMEKFRTPFGGAVAAGTTFFRYGAPPDEIRDALRARDDVAAIVVEPIQGRGGCIVPPKGWLCALRAVCDDLRILLVLDEIYTGFGRTGFLFACEHDEIVPDILCIGKAMGNGVPISAAIARPEVMDAWPRSEGEALHTSTYLGNPLGCAAALAVLEEVERLNLIDRARTLGIALGVRLQRMREKGKAQAVRGRGFMWGLELGEPARAQTAVKRALHGGVILLQAGPTGSALSIAPPLTIPENELFKAIDVVEESL